ncbi:Mu transposase C-terminal domain-containing protein [Vibrio sp. THAF190c]|uniref:Mu transposase C-terminal domain-containing protein n=1 Tax=Vibrio sp. THAF190c TaxID=2587865 RepID=UPI001267A310|nr:Mu transposase C-terminal domain-containing protein [Vibrio sp. THAF190c]QFT11218.1 Transposon Tn7 transposition protein TnsB [Vibrio sp. THAF190c]
MSSITPGKLVYWDNKAAIVLELKGFSEAIIRIIETGITEVVRASNLSLRISTPRSEQGKHLLAKDKEWEVALSRFETIKPLLEKSTRTESDVERVAFECGKGVTTIYRWLKRFEETGLVSSLLRQQRTDKGHHKLNAEVEELIATQITKIYLQKERPSVLKLYRIIKSECIDADLPVPHKNTIYARVRTIEDRELVKKRVSPKASKQNYEPVTGKFPGADYPNSVVQIDHTKVDLIIVDEEHRLPIGRPYLTIAIDVATKMISGFKVTLDPPSSSSVGLCIAHAITPKENWLAKRDIDVEWPIYGKMEKIHVDNGKDFRSNMLKRACQQHNIILEFRPKGQPNYGPHVERAFRTFMQEVQGIPGTTFSSVKDRLDYDSEGNACMTLSELELWFTTFIVYCYHHRPHKGINKVPPIQVYTEAILGNKDKPGIGLPQPVEDEESLRLDFTPYVERTVQRTGVVIDNIHYYSDVLRKWIGAVDESDRNKKRKFIFARDPRDISSVYFLDPDTQRYISVPYLNSQRPTISLWELNAVSSSLSEEKSPVDEDAIFRGIRKMRQIESDAIEKTRLAKQHRANEKRKRRMAERRNHWQSSTQKIATVDDTHTEILEEFDDDIQPFTDVEIS